MRLIFLLLILSGPVPLTQAQLRRIPGEGPTSPRWSLKYSPLGLIETDQALSLAAEYRPIQALGLQVEVSGIFNTLSVSDQRVPIRTRGFRVVPEFRWYDADFKPRLSRYIGIQVGLKSVQRTLETWVEQGGFQQQELVNLRKFNGSSAVILGILRHGRRLGWDLNLGLGAKYKVVELPDDPNRRASGWPLNIYGEPVSGWYPQPSATFKICYHLGQWG